MNIPVYVTKEEVRRVCSAIGIRDWTALTEAKVEIEEANVIKTLVGGETLAISAEVSGWIGDRVGAWPGFSGC
jgi:hypothetical protein